MSLGDAFVNVHANVDPFKAELAPKLAAVLAAAGKTGTAGFQKIAAGADVATRSIEGTTAATAALTAEEIKLATASARLAATRANATAAESRAITAGLNAARAQQAADLAPITAFNKRQAQIQKVLEASQKALAKSQSDAEKESLAATEAANKARLASYKKLGAEVNSIVKLSKQRETALVDAAYAQQDLIAQVSADHQARIARELQNALALLRQRQAQEAELAAAAEEAIAQASADRQEAIASHLANRLVLLDQRRAETAQALADRQEAIAAQLANRLALLDQRRADAAEAVDAQVVAAAQASADAREAIEAQMANRLILLDQRWAQEAERAYARIAVIANGAADIQERAAARTAAANTLAAKALKNSFAGGFAKEFDSLGKDFGKKIGKGIKGIPGDVFGAITTSAKFATVGVLGLGAALAGIGLVSAAKQQAALVGFTALAAQISATTDATTGLTTATKGLSDVQSRAIGDEFLHKLIDLSNNSALSQSALQDTSQALLALGFNGDQSLGIIRDIGNALAASGKTGGGLNDDLRGIVVAFSQIRGSGRLLAQDLNQITTRIPSAGRVQVYAELAKNLKAAGYAGKLSNKDIQKLAKEGLIDADLAIASITKALEGVPGAAATAANGFQDALARQNLTLTGRFEALKDNIRTALAAAFLLPGEAGGGKSLADRLADQLGAFIPVITAAIKKIGPPLSQFLLKFEEFGARVLPPLVGLIGKVFGLLGKGLSALDNNLTGIVDKFKAFGTVLQNVGIGPTLLQAFKLIRDALPPIIALIAGAAVALVPVLSIVYDIYRVIFALLAPAVKGVALAFGTIGTLLAPVAAKIREITDALVGAFGNDIVAKMGLVAGAAYGVATALTVAKLATINFSKALLGLTGTIVKFAIPGLELLVIAIQQASFFLAANPFVAGALAIAALGAAAYYAWTNFALFQTIVVDTAKALLELPLLPLVGILEGIKIALLGLAAAQPVVDILFKIGEAIGLLTGITEVVYLAVFAVKELIKHFGDITGAVSTAGSAVATAFSAVVGFFESVGAVIADVASNVAGVVEKIVAKFADVFSFIGTVVSDVASAIGGFVLDVIDKLSFLAPAFSAIGTAISAVGDVVRTVFGGIGQVISFIAGLLKDFIGKVADLAAAVAKLPGIPDYSGPLRDAANSMGDLSNQGLHAFDVLDAVKGGLNSINGSVANASVVIDIRTNNPFAASSVGELPGSLPISPENTAAAQAAEQVRSTADALAANWKKGFGGIASTADSAAKKAADKAKQIAETFNQAIKDIIAGLDKDFRNSLVTGSRKQIDTALDALTKKIASVFKAAGKKRPNALLVDIQSDNTKLKDLADARDKILDRLKAATDRFNEVQQSIKDFASVSSLDLESIGLAATNAKAATEKLADLSRLRIVLPGEATLNTFTGGDPGKAAKSAADSSAAFAKLLADRLAQITKFNADVASLVKSGLNKTTIDQIISAGPEGGGPLAAALTGASKATIDAINQTQQGIDAAAKELGNQAADSLFRAGTEVVAGLIQGLKDQSGAIKDAMKKIANDLVAEIKARLKVKSPSRVLHAIGRMVGAGLHIGMASKGAEITKAAQSMADAAVPTIAPVEMAGITTPNLDPVTQRVVAKLDSSAVRFDPVTVRVLAEMADVEARANLTPVARPDVSATTHALVSLAHPEGAWTRADIARLHRGLESVPGPSTTYRAPITNHFHGQTVDPHATAKHMAKVIGSLR